MNTQQTKTTNKTELAKSIREAIEGLKEHWVYDAVQLLNDSAVALQRIEQLLKRLQREPEWLAGREPKLMKEVSELVLFIKEWDSLAHERLTESLVCPDEVESRLRSLLRATNVPIRVRKKMRRRWSTEDSLSLLEPAIVDIARRSRN